ncbi:MAG: gamma carbonic anhydrase family protein [Myxococcota bacterium]
MNGLRLDPALLDLDPDAFVAQGATLIGDVKVGAGSSIWFQAVVRGDEEAIRIGAGSNIQDGAILHADPGFACEIGDGVTVGHGAVVHGARVEDGAVIGMNATVLNGAVIGAGAIIAAGAVVPENSVIPPHTLAAGVPAKVRRELHEHESAPLGAVARYYAENGRTYRAAGYAQEAPAGPALREVA